MTHRGLSVAVAVAALSLAACDRTEPPAPVTYGDPGSRASHPAANPAAPTSVVVQRGDSIHALARRYRVPVKSLIVVNNLEPPYTLRAGQTLVLPPSHQYKVQRGDSVSKIARQYQVAAPALIRLNGLKPPFGIQVDQVLVLPDSSTEETDSATRSSTMAVNSVPSPPPTRLSSSPSSRPGSVMPGKVTSVPLEDVPPAPAATPSAPSSTSAFADPIRGGRPKPETTAAPPSPKAVSAIKLPVEDSVAEAEPEPPVTPPAASPVAPQNQPIVPPVQPQAQPVAPPATTQLAAVTIPDPSPRAGHAFLWPVTGKVVSRFGAQGEGMQNDGVNIAAPKGTPVRAAENGVVVYTGNELKGFGNLLLIKHADGWMTAYAHHDKISVHRGDKVKRGQVVGTVGSTGSAAFPQLHFEVRRGTKPVDPAPYMEGGPKV
ncbi:MAG: peptidoglycan DD-metalloendopeptidase family protein [Alphaproteobacteria bacterium]|nr:peptidoglycan DD-metalloendopeptidase family protein [Alphaproteobacteria bacterium]